MAEAGLDEKNRKSIGVYLCKCRGEISDRIDLSAASKKISQSPFINSVKIHQALCSVEGRSWLKENIKTCSPQRVLIGACDPDATGCAFTQELQEVGINKYLFEQVNLRELCAWVHTNSEEATIKAINIIQGQISRFLTLNAADDLTFKIEPATLVIGGGWAGVRAALQVAKAGFKVYIIEKQSVHESVKADIKRELAIEKSGISENEIKRSDDILNENKIEFFFNSEVEKIDGYFGNRKVMMTSPEGKRELVVGTIILSPDRENHIECKKIADMLHIVLDIDRNKEIDERYNASTNRGILVIPFNEDLKGSIHLIKRMEFVVADLIRIMQNGTVKLPRIVASVDDFRCRGCGRCKEMCEFGAISIVKKNDDEQIAQVDEFRCEGCGICTFACCNAAMSINNFGPTQLFANVMGVLEEVEL